MTPAPMGVGRSELRERGTAPLDVLARGGVDDCRAAKQDACVA